MELNAHEERMVFDFDRFHDATVGGFAAYHKSAFFKRFEIIGIEFVSVAVSFFYHVAIAVCFFDFRAVFECAGVCAKAHRSADFLAFLVGQNVDDVAAAFGKFTAGCVFYAKHVASVFDDGDLHAEADSQIRYFVRARVFAGCNHALNASCAEAAGDDDSVNVFKFFFDVFVGDGFAVNPFEFDARFVCAARVLDCLDEPTAVLTPQEIDELMQIMRNLAAEGKSILFITHKLNEIMAVADRCSVLRKGKYIGTVNVADTTKEELSTMMVGHAVKFAVDKDEAQPKEELLDVKGLCVRDKIHKKEAVKDVSFTVHSGEIVCIAGIDGNGQSELVYAITGLEPVEKGTIVLNGEDITKKNIRHRNTHGMSHIPEDRHKHGLVLDYSLEQNMVLQRYFEPQFQKGGFIKFDEVRKYAEGLIDKFDVRSGQGPITKARSMSGGNQQKAIVARELDRPHNLLVAVQPTRGLDVGAIEYIHAQIVKDRDEGAGVLLVSLELDEVMNLSDRILVMYEGEIVGELDPKKTTVQELGLYMAGAKRNVNKLEQTESEDTNEQGAEKL